MPTAAPTPVPEGMSTVTAHLWFSGNAGEAIEFYKSALGATLDADPVPAPDGRGIWHAMIRVGDTNLMAADAFEDKSEAGPTDHTTVGFFVYVEDCDAWYERALAAGCKVVDPIQDMFWGDRVGKVQDPYGHVWAFATHKWSMTEEEMATLAG